LALLKNNFQVKYDSVKDTKTTDLSEAQTIILASIIERRSNVCSGPAAGGIGIYKPPEYWHGLLVPT